MDLSGGSLSIFVYRPIVDRLRIKLVIIHSPGHSTGLLYKHCGPIIDIFASDDLPKHCHIAHTVKSDCVREAIKEKKTV